MKAYKGSFSANTGTGNQTISGIVDEGGNAFTPTVLLVWSTFGTSAAFADGWTWYMGVTDGTTSSSSCTAASDNVAAQRGRTSVASVLCTVINSAGTTLRAGAFVSFASGQFTINWTTATGSSEIFHYLALNTTSVKLTTISQDGSIARTPPASGLFQPQAVLGVNLGAAGAGANGTGIGWYAPKADGSFSQGFGVVQIRDNLNPSQCFRYERTDNYRGTFATSGVVPLIVVARDMYGDAPTVAGSTSTFTAATLALAGVSAMAGSGLQPTSTGTQAITGLGFSPKCVLIMSVGGAASTSTQNDAKLCVGGADRTRQGYAIAGSLNGVTPSVCVTNETTSKVIGAITPNATAASSTIDAEAGIQSIDSDGFTLNWTTADATQREYVWLALGDAIGAGGGSHTWFGGS